MAAFIDCLAEWFGAALWILMFVYIYIAVYRIRPPQREQETWVEAMDEVNHPSTMQESTGKPNEK